MPALMPNYFDDIYIHMLLTKDGLFNCSNEFQYLVIIQVESFHQNSSLSEGFFHYCYSIHM